MLFGKCSKVPICVEYVVLKVRMYLETGAVAPYCKHHYLLQLHLAKPRQAEAWVQVCTNAYLAL